MRKHFLLLFLVVFTSSVINSQTRGTKIGYIDMEYILQNVPNYIEANNQLEQKAQKWKQEIELKKNEINKIKEELKIEKTLLTKSLIEERESEIKFLENETLELQQMRFGPNGNLMTQKADLIKPIQDQVFTAIQDIAETQKYDFIFDKTSDMTMLFAAKRYDISDLILRIINRADKREQLSKKQLQAELDKEQKEDAIDVNPNLVERQKALDARKAERDKILEDRKIAAEQKKQEAEDKRAQILAEREAKKNGTSIPTTTGTDDAKETAKNKIEDAKEKQIEANAKALEDRKKLVEDRKAELEAKRKQILEDREAQKNGTVSETSKKIDTKTTTASSTSNENAKPEITPTNTADDARAKALEERTKIIEDRKKAIEEKREKALQVRDSIKKARETQIKQ
ncbi:OmpH family outer membrane protein [Flavobacterium sp.]|uniref:OmpH family outer membrane protein n=1 Tax=Flavobacterium sp. TaxID=239 RepID=UPI003C57C753